MSASPTTAAAILKTQYTKDRVYWLTYDKNPEIAMVDRHEDFGGDFYMVPVQTETPQGGSAGGFSQAQSNEAPSKYYRYQLTRTNDFAVANISGEAWQAAASNTYALVELFTREVDGAIHTNKRSLAISFFRDGTGQRGFINSSVGANVITLSKTADITNFAVGMFLQAVNVAGGTLRSAGATAQITAIDRLNGILTFGDVLTNFIAAAANGDCLIRAGDNNNVMTGSLGWIPQANATATTFFGLNRTVDPVRLAGQFYNASGQSMRAAIIEVMGRIATEGGDSDMIWVHTRDKSLLIQELEGKSLYQKQVEVPVPESDQTIGFRSLEADFDGSTVRIMDSVNVPRYSALVGEWDTVSMYSLGMAPQIIDYDNLEALRVYNQDAFEVRIVSRSQLGWKAPGYWGQILNFGQ